MGRLPLCSGLQEQQELGDPVLRLSRTAESLDNEDFSRKPFLFLYPDLFFLPLSPESLQEASPRLADHGGSSGGAWEVKRSQRLRRGPSSPRRPCQDMEYERR